MSSKPLFRQEALDHQRDRLFGQALIIWPLSLKLMGLSAALIGAAFVAFTIWGEYTRKVNVSGFLAPDKGFIKVYPREVATITQRRVQEGQFVKKADVLFVLSLDRGSTSGLGAAQVAITEIRRRREALLSEKSKLAAIGQSQTDQLQKRIFALNNEHQKIDHEIQWQRQRVETFRKTVERYKQLLAEQFISPHQLQQQTSLLLEQEVLLGSFERNKLAIARELESSKEQLPEVGLRTQNELSAIERQLSNLDQDLAEMQARREQIVVASTDGIVTGIQAEEGQIVNPSIPLLNILPAGSYLEARVLAPAAAVGFIKPGKKVQLRYAAYPYQRFGHQLGRVKEIAKTITSPNELPGPLKTQEPFYMVTISLEQQAIKAYGDWLPLQSGMTLQADIMLDKRPIYHWVLEPLFSITGQL